jgi:hypothetical protein
MCSVLVEEDITLIVFQLSVVLQLGVLVARRHPIVQSVSRETMTCVKHTLRLRKFSNSSGVKGCSSTELRLGS